MSTIVTRAGKGSPLTWNEVDNNFTNLNTDKYQSGSNVSLGTIAGTTITSSALTSGRVTFASTGGLLADSASLFWDNTNARLGIGTASPLQALDVRGRTGLYGASDAYQLKLSYVIGTAGFWLGSPSANALSFYNDAGAERMRIDSSGNVGLGSSTITGIGANVTTLKIAGRNTTNAGGIQLYSSDDTTVKARTWAETGGWYFDLQTAQPMIFSTSGTERMRLDSSGNLGLGVTPSAWNTATKNIQNPAGSIYSVGTTDTGIVQNAFLDSTGTWKYVNTAAASYFAQTGGAFSWASVTSGTAGATAGLTNKMTLDLSGNLGLGVTPSAWSSSFKAMQISGASIWANATGTYISQNNYFASGGYTYITSNLASDYYQSAGTHVWRTAPSGTAGATFSPTTAMTLDASGRLGIGSSSPTARLMVEHGRNTSAIVGYTLTDGFNSSINMQAGYGNAAASMLYTGTGEALLLGTANTERMRINSSGQLGVGCTPSGWTLGKVVELGTVGNSLWSAGTADIRLTANTYYNGVFRYAVTGSAAATFEIGGGAYTWRSAASGTAGNTITWTDSMTLNASGQLLLGTASAIAGSTGPLQVYSGGTDGIVVRQTGSASNDCIAMWHSATSGNNTFVAFFTETSITGRGSITYNRSAGLTAYNTTSDYRLKENIVDLPDALESVLMLKPRKFSWKETGNVTTGFIAHELAEVCPHAVSGEKDATREEEYEISPAIPAVLDDEGVEVTPAVEAAMGIRTVPVYQGIDTSFLVATLTAAIQEQQAMIDELKAKVAALEAA